MEADCLVKPAAEFGSEAMAMLVVRRSCEFGTRQVIFCLDLLAEVKFSENPMCLPAMADFSDEVIGQWPVGSSHVDAIEVGSFSWSLVIRQVVTKLFVGAGKKRRSIYEQGQAVVVLIYI